MRTTPKSNRKTARNVADIPFAEPILFAVRDTLGLKVLVARCQEGVCAVFADDSEQYVRNRLTEAFPQHELVEDPGALQKDMDQVFDYINF